VGTEQSWARLDYEQTLAKLVELLGRDLLVEIRIDASEGEPRVSALGQLLGTEDPTSAGRRSGHEHMVFDLDSGGTFTILESRFVNGEWQTPGGGEDLSRGTLTIVSQDCEIKIVALGGRVREPAEGLT
jgi:hypothetical protein